MLQILRNLFVLLFSPMLLCAQYRGGSASFPLLELSTSAQQMALGGRNITHTGPDPYLFLLNPAIKDSSHIHKLSLNYHSYFADIRSGTVAYCLDLPKIGLLSTAIQYLNYGSAISYDISGNAIGEVQGNDFIATIGYALGKRAIKVGANAKIAGSQIGGNNAYALGIDMGALFIHPKKDVRIAMQIRHIGYSIAAYSNHSERPRLPLDPRVGISFKPTHMPIRFHVTAHALHRLGTIYDDPNAALLYDFAGQDRLPRINLTERLFRHITLGAEFLFFKKITLRTGYSHQVKQELRYLERTGLSGFSWGVGLRTKKLELSYSRNYHYASRGRNTLSLILSIEKHWKKQPTTNAQN